MKYLIIGLGIYGANLATDLTDMGAEVIGADIKQARVDAVKDFISTAYIVDSTDETALEVLPLRNVDVAIVAIGENFGASIKTVAILKKHGLKCIYARAIDDLHQAILEGLDVQRILTPEQRAARDLVGELAFGSKVKSLQVAPEYFVMKFEAPEQITGTLYSTLLSEGISGLKLVSASRSNGSTNILGIHTQESNVIQLNDQEEKVEKGDELICYGHKKDFLALYRHLT